MKFAVLVLAVSGLCLGSSAAPGVSKSQYLDLIEAAVGAYTPEHMRAYHARVKKKGIREHGFPRLAANLGVLVAHGRRPADRELFRAMMDTCCAQMSTALEASKREKKEQPRRGQSPEQPRLTIRPRHEFRHSENHVHSPFAIREQTRFLRTSSHFLVYYPRRSGEGN